MFIYKIIQGEYTFKEERLFYNEKCYTQEEFKNLIKNIINGLSKEQKMYHNTMYEVEDILIESYGFKPYEIPIQASVYDEWDIKDLE